MSEKKEEKFLGIDDRGNNEWWANVVKRVRVKLKEERDAMTPEERAQRRAGSEARKAASLEQNNSQ